MKKILLLAVLMLSVQMYGQITIEYSNDTIETKYGYTERKLILYSDKTGYAGVNLSDEIDRIPKGVKIPILEDLGKELQVVYNNKIGYVASSGVKDGKEYDEEIENRKRLLKAQEENARLIAEEAIERVSNEKEEREEIMIKEKEEREERMIKKYGNYNGKRISKGVIAIGMTKAMVQDSWGKPSDINTTTYSWGTNEQWVYGLGRYVYFESGKVKAIQN